MPKTPNSLVCFSLPMPHSPVSPLDHQPTFPSKGATKRTILVGWPGDSCTGKMDCTKRQMPPLSHLRKRHQLPPPSPQPQQGTAEERAAQPAAGVPPFDQCSTLGMSGHSGSPAQPMWPASLGDCKLTCPTRPDFQHQRQPLLPYVAAVPLPAYRP
ncbi:hypothetical protein E2320_001924, partial [Naja naja]